MGFNISDLTRRPNALDTLLMEYYDTTNKVSKNVALSSLVSGIYADMPVYVENTKINQLITNTVSTALSFDDGAGNDPFNFHDHVSDPENFVVPAGMGGKYLTILSQYTAVSLVRYRVDLWHRKGGIAIAYFRRVWFDTETCRYTTVHLAHLNAGDVWSAALYHNMGSQRAFNFKLLMLRVSD